MIEFWKVGLTAVLTAVVFVFGQLVQRIVIEPLQEMRKTLGRIVHAQTFYSNVMPRRVCGNGYVGDTPEELEVVRKELRGLAADLRAHRKVIPGYRLFVRLRVVPPDTALEEMATNLIGWSNSMGGGNKAERIAAIGKALEFDSRN